MDVPVSAMRGGRNLRRPGYPVPRPSARDGGTLVGQGFGVTGAMTRRRSIVEESSSVLWKVGLTGRLEGSLNAFRIFFIAFTSAVGS